MHMGGKSYLPSEFSRYQKDCGQDRNSRIVEPLFGRGIDFDSRFCHSF